MSLFDEGMGLKRILRAKTKTYTRSRTSLDILITAYRPDGLSSLYPNNDKENDRAEQKYRGTIARIQYPSENEPNNAC